MKEQLQRLVAHALWADRRVVEGLLAAEGVPPEVLELALHVLAAEEVWLSRLEGRPAEVPVWPERGAVDLAELLARNAERYAAYVAGLDEAGLSASVDYVNSAGQSFTSRVDDVLLQVLLHGAYHRGQISTRLRAAGLEPAPTDYIAFVRGAPAATRADRPGESR